MVLKSPKLDGSTLTFKVDVLEGTLADAADADGPAAVFIDIIGLPRTPLSYAGVARRTAYRGAFYGAAAVRRGGSRSARPPMAPSTRSAPYYPPPPCGYYPYPPCY